MDLYYNKIDIGYYNMVITKKVDQKVLILNKLLNLLKCNRNTNDLINYIYSINPKNFIEFIKLINKPSLIMLTYDLIEIGKFIEIPENTCITYSNNAINIEYISEDSPKSILSDYSCKEWGLS